MKKGESKRKLQQIRLKAREDYVRGDSKYEIAKRYQRAKKTIVEWSKKYRWDEARQKAIQEAERNSDWNVTQDLGRTLKLIRAAESVYAEELQQARNEGKGLPKSTAAMAALFREKREIIRPQNISHYNLFKQDNIAIHIKPEELKRIEEALEKYGA